MLDRLVGELLKVPARAWREMFGGLLHYDDVAELGSITAPTLLIWGDADGVIDRGMQDTLAARLPLSDLVVYPGVGHTPRWRTHRASLPTWPHSSSVHCRANLMPPREQMAEPAIVSLSDDRYTRRTPTAADGVVRVS